MANNNNNFSEEKVTASHKIIHHLKKELKKTFNILKMEEQEISLLDDLMSKVENETEALRSINEIIGCSLPLDDTLELVMDYVLKITESEAGSLLLVNKNTGNLDFKVVKGKVKDKIKSIHIKLGNGICGWVAKEGKSIIANDLRQEKRFRRNIPVKFNFETRNILCIPLKIKNSTIGTIEVINKKRKSGYTDHDEILLSSLSNQIAIVIENTRLLEKSEKKIKELSTLMEVSKAINSTLNLEELLSIVMNLAKNVMRAEASSLMLLDEESKELIFKVALGEKGEKVKDYRVPVGKGISGWVAKHGKPLLIPDVSKDKRFFSELDKKTDFKTRDILCVPLLIKDKIIGVIQVINSIGRRCFSQDDIGFFEAMARESAVAIENARLFTDLENLIFDIIKSFALSIEARDPYTRGHSERVTNFSLIIAKEMNLPEKEIEVLKETSLLHDIGKIGVRDSVLLKPSSLTDEEFEQIKLHPSVGSNIVCSIRHLRHIIPGIRSHHERIDGRGYPDKLAGDEIPLFGRIISVADAFDAMTSDRPYRNGIEKEKSLEIIKANIGTQFDPIAAKAFISAYEKGLILTEREEKALSENSSVPAS